MKNNLYSFLYILIIGFLASLSISIFLIIRPYDIIDTNSSKIICPTGSAFDMGPNYVYAFENKLNSFNDLQARKLCAYGIIRDFGDSYESPKEKNYKVIFVTKRESSWLRAFFLFLLSVFGGILTIEWARKKLAIQHYRSLQFFACLILTSLFLFVVVMRPIEKRLFCFGKVIVQVTNFRKSAYKNGVFRSEIQENDIHKSANTFYESCVAKTI